MRVGVRKHRAPKGALRPVLDGFGTLFQVASQKAPSAKRCIKTLPGQCSRASLEASESTERHKAHYDSSATWASGQDTPVGEHRVPKGALRLGGL